MTLEIIHRVPTSPRSAAPLLFVHGANSGAWVWDVKFLPYFADRGYHASAVSLRGHGGSDGQELLQMASLADYAADVALAIDQIRHATGRAPVLIGHSMGGMVLQKVLQNHRDVEAMVLMASVPPQGLMATSMLMMLRDPFLFQRVAVLQSLGPFGLLMPAAFTTIKEILFSEDMPDDEVAKYERLWQPESMRVVLDMCGVDLPRPVKRPGLQVLVLGGADDLMVPPSLTSATASAFGTVPHIFPHVAHAMMLDTGWEDVAASLADWLDGEIQLAA